MATTGLIAQEYRADSLNLGGIARDIATMGSGTLLATFFNVLLIFLVPRLVSVEDYGYWRLFMLYIGYAGLLHLGLADGALLCWSGRPLEDFRQEILASLKFLLWQHVAVILPAFLAIELLLRPDLRFVGVSILAFTLLSNAITLLQFGLQSARNFTPVAVSMAGPLGVFLSFVFLWELRRVPDFRVLILLYMTSSSAGLVYLFAQGKGRFVGRSAQSVWKVGWNYISIGWPVLLANIGLSVVQSADRLVISWAATIQNFAQYSLAASSTMTVVLAIVVAAFRVVFPHLASLQRERHKSVYVAASKFLFVSWSLLLPYYFVLESFVNRMLPKYSGSLPIAYFLLMGTVFLGVITILHASFFCLYGRQKAFLWSTLTAIVLGFLSAEAAISWARSLRMVAIGEVLTLALWWAFNEWKLRGITGQTYKEWGQSIALFCEAVIIYGVALRQAHTLFPRICIYYALVACALWLTCSTELSLGFKFLENSRARVH